MPTKRLPPSANLAHLKHQARDLLSDVRDGKMPTLQRFREFHPRFGGLSDTAMTNAVINLSDAQLSIAREYGYASWPRLKAAVERASNQTTPPIHNDRLDDGPFKQALEYLDHGNAALLKSHLLQHPQVVHQQVVFEGDNYFTNPTLIEFIAENPTRQNRLPDNIVEIAQIILDAGAKDNKAAMDAALTLVASGRVVREHGVQMPLLTLLCDHGADPAAGLGAALVHGEFDAAQVLLARGAPMDLPTAAALGLQTEVAQRLTDANQDQLQHALALSALHNRADIVTMLLRAGADPNRFNPPGGHSHCTPLHSAAWAGHLEAAKALVDGGARCDIGDIHHNANALDWAEYAGRSDVARYLKSRL